MGKRKRTAGMLSFLGLSGSGFFDSLEGWKAEVFRFALDVGRGVNCTLIPISEDEMISLSAYFGRQADCA